jgi:hypothetical protein
MEGAGELVERRVQVIFNCSEPSAFALSGFRGDLVAEESVSPTARVQDRP